MNFARVHVRICTHKKCAPSICPVDYLRANKRLAAFGAFTSLLFDQTNTTSFVFGKRICFTLRHLHLRVIRSLLQLVGDACAAEAVAAQQRAKALSQFEPRWVEGVYLGLSNSVGGGRLVYAGDSFLHTKNVKPKAAVVDPGPPEVEPGDGVSESLAPNEGDEPCRGGDGPARRRLTGKGPPRMARAVSGELVEVEQHDGDAVSEAEAFAREVLYEEWEITSEIVEELFELLPGDPPPRKCEERPGEDMEEEKAWSSGAFIRGGIGGSSSQHPEVPVCHQGDQSLHREPHCSLGQQVEFLGDLQELEDGDAS